MEKIELTIDNKKIEVDKGTTVLKAARQAGIDIPTLCHMELHSMNIENKPVDAVFVWWKWKVAGTWHPPVLRKLRPEW